MRAFPRADHAVRHRRRRPARAGLAALAGAALLLAPAAAPAAAAPSVQPGTYTGADSDENGTSLRVTGDGKVAEFTITVFPSCTDAAGVTATLARPITINEDGTFTAEATHKIDADGGQVTALSKISGKVRPDGIAEGRYEWELRDHVCSASAYFWLRNEDTTAGEPPRPTGPVTVIPGAYNDGARGQLTVSADRRITKLTVSYSWYCGLSYAGERLALLETPAQIRADGSFFTRISDSAGGTETLRGQFHHDGSVWGTVSYVNGGTFCSGSTGFTMRPPGGGGGGGGPTFYLNNGWGPHAHNVFDYGRRADEVFIGDWDGNGTDTVALRRGSRFYVSNSLRGGEASTAFAYGRPGDVILVGDWDGDGVDTFAVRRGSEYHVKNSIAGGKADHVVHYGRGNDDVIVGDWDGDGRDTFAVRRGSQYFVKNRIAGGTADHVLAYGRPADVVLAGDWDGDRRDTFAVRRGAHYYVKNRIAGGNADLVRVYGRPTDEVHVGDWDGDGRDTLGVRRVS
ncbi:hypothetical protein M3148_08675 [Georgenia satyanarayanai]|uniref:hypothetical protein n=1 Tax=Georgenia satyanarayanai TaxID=860221 RepID=UPI00203DB49D|nr:hypothetical protein [Georgenia satyanarayanai]MCM3661064.1 hypothetical protein [Georgenia satyanarayanai]